MTPGGPSTSPGSPPPMRVADLRRIRRALGFGILSMILGGLLATLAGFAFTAVAGTSCFEGFCAYVPFLWFAPLGMLTGFVVGAKLGGRQPPPEGASTDDRRP